MFELTNELLVMILTFVLVFFVTTEAVNKFLKKRAISVVIGFIISLLAVRFLSYSQLGFIFQTYGLAGIAVLILVPFSLIFFFVYSSDILGIFRKAIWIFYGAVTVGVLQGNSSFSSESTTSVTLIVILVVVVILFVDNYISGKLRAWRNLRKNY